MINVFEWGSEVLPLLRNMWSSWCVMLYTDEMHTTFTVQRHKLRYRSFQIIYYHITLLLHISISQYCIHQSRNKIQQHPLDNQWKLHPSVSFTHFLINHLLLFLYAFPQPSGHRNDCLSWPWINISRTSIQLHDGNSPAPDNNHGLHLAICFPIRYRSSSNSS